MKKISTFLFSLILLLALSVPALADSGTLTTYLQTDKKEVYQADTVQLEFLVGMDGTCDTYGYSLELDPAVFTVVSYEILDTNRIQFASFDEKGLVVAYGTPATPTDVVCRVTLQAREDAPLGQYEFTGKPAAMLNGQQLEVVDHSVSVEVLCKHTYAGWHQTDADNHTGECVTCGHVEVTSHNWDTGAVTKEATCTETGTIIHVCVDCHEVKVAELPAQHSYDNDCDTDCNTCGQNRSILHEYEEGWEYDENGHYHVCKICGAMPAKKAHKPDSGKATEETAVLCKDCGYIITPVVGHTHNFSQELTADASGHWNSCSGCMQKQNAQEHTFANDCDATCDDCGYVRKTTHVISKQWTSNEEGHYRTCTVCGETMETLLHAPGEEATEFTPKTCMVCGRELSAALGHTMSEQWYFNEEVHYHQCACGATDGEAAHVWSDHGEDGYVTCTVCGAKTEAVSMVVWIALGAAALVALVCVIVVLTRKKKAVEA